MPHNILKVPKNGMLEGFERALARRGIVADEAQHDAAMRLQHFYDGLIAFKAARRTKLRRLLARPDLPKGVWFWGGVGRGKSFLMDCFFDSVPYQRKRRVHFHAFMQEIHERLQAVKNEADPLARVAAQVAKETRLMCFDEFHVSDIADAMILGRLMQALFDAGVLFCITSNYEPDGLYPNGLQRERLLPTIALLNERLDVIRVDAGVDYRLRALEQADIYHVPGDDAADRQLMATFRRIAGGEGRDRPPRPGGTSGAGRHLVRFRDAVRRTPVPERLPGIGPPEPHRLPLAGAPHGTRQGADSGSGSQPAVPRAERRPTLER